MSNQGLENIYRNVWNIMDYFLTFILCILMMALTLSIQQFKGIYFALWNYYEWKYFELKQYKHDLKINLKTNSSNNLSMKYRYKVLVRDILLGNCIFVFHIKKRKYLDWQLFLLLYLLSVPWNPELQISRTLQKY